MSKHFSINTASGVPLDCVCSSPAVCCAEMTIQSQCDYTRASCLLDVDYFAGISSQSLKCVSVNLITGFNCNFVTHGFD